MPRMAAGLCSGARGERSRMAFDDIGGDQAALLELLAAVDHAVTDGIDLADAVNDFAVAGGHLLDDFAERFGMGGEDCRRRGLLTVGFMGDHAAFHADTFTQAFAEHLLTVHIDELVLQARRTAVDNQNFHGVSSFSGVRAKGPFRVTKNII